MERIGFVGLGNMGAPMSANVAKAGFPLTVFDIDRAVAGRRAQDVGAACANSLEELAAASDVVVTMLPNGTIVRDLMLGADGSGLASHLRPGALLIDMSSSDPIGTRELAPRLAARGIGFIDAPVSGAVPRARAATLTIMVGSDSADLAKRADPILRAMGDRVFAAGGVGAGHALKALNNYVAAAGFAAAAEALILARRFGLAPELVVDVMNVSSGRNFSTENVFKSQVLSGAFASGFGVSLLTKDVAIAAGLGDAFGEDLPLIQETLRWWRAAERRLDAGADHTSAYRAWDRGIAGSAQ